MSRIFPHLISLHIKLSNFVPRWNQRRFRCVVSGGQEIKSIRPRLAKCYVLIFTEAGWPMSPSHGLPVSVTGQVYLRRLDCIWDVKIDSFTSLAKLESLHYPSSLSPEVQLNLCSTDKRHFVQYLEILHRV